jgi:acyl transferase domain-containing protein
LPAPSVKKPFDFALCDLGVESCFDYPAGHMFDEPSETPAERSLSAADQAREKADEFRMHAELAAVFEACRKFDAQILPALDPELAREIQRTFARLEKSKSPDSPTLPEPSIAQARELLNMAKTRGLSTNDYHIYRRPGEVMIVRWLAGEEVATFYERLQAHFDAALAGCREDERQANDWKKDPHTLAYLAALDAVEVKMADRYLRDFIRVHQIFVLSTQSADELNIAYLSDHIMGVSAADIVGAKSAPPEEPTERDLAWFFKLFSLRGVNDGVELMCFFTYLQKSDDGFGE